MLNLLFSSEGFVGDCASIGLLFHTWGSLCSCLVRLPEGQAKALDGLFVMSSVHTHDLFTCWDLEVFPGPLACLIEPVLVDQIVASLIKNSEAVNVATDLVMLIDVEISDAAVRLYVEFLGCALLLAVWCINTDNLTLDPTREVQFHLV